MDTFRILTQIVPKHVGILEMGLRITLLGMDKMWEFGGVADEEYWSVVEHPIEVTFSGADLDGESTGIAGGVC